MGLTNSCACYRDLQLKSNQKVYKKPLNLTNNKFFIFGINKSKKSFISCFDPKKSELISLPINQNLWNFSGSIIVNEDYLFLCGGVNYTMDQITNKAFQYSIKTNEFQALPSMSTKKFNFPCILFRNKVYAIGGRSYGSGEEAILSDCESFDLIQGKWTGMPNMEIPRCGHQLLIYKEMLYVVGGLSFLSDSKKFECFNFYENSWTILDLKLQMNLFNFEIYPKDVDEFYIIGGCHQYGISNFIHSVNLKQKTVETIGFMKAPRSHFKMFFESSRNRLVLFGGVPRSNPLLKLRYAETFDLVTKKLETLHVDFESQMDFIEKNNFGKFSCKIRSSEEMILEDSIVDEERY